MSDSAAHESSQSESAPAPGSVDSPPKDAEQAPAGATEVPADTVAEPDGAKGATVLTQGSQVTPPSVAGPLHARYLRASWRVRLAVRLRQLEHEAAQVADGPPKTLVHSYLAEAWAGLTEKPTVMVRWRGLDIERAWQNTHAAEVALIRADSPESLTARLASLIEECAVALPNDSRLPELKTIRDKGTSITATQQVLAAGALQSAHAVSDAQHVQVRSFRNILLAVAAVLIALAGLVAIVAAFAPQGFAVCASSSSGVASCPAGAHHPTGPDVIIVEILGLAGAAITSAAAVRKLSGTSTPYAVPLASLALKLPTGALTALLGLLLIQAGFASTITATSSAAVIGWAVVFGASQQVFMQFIDKQAQSVLNAVPTPGASPKPKASKAAH